LDLNHLIVQKKLQEKVDKLAHYVPIRCLDSILRKISYQVTLFGSNC
jgi:hypothetical protein